MAGCRLRELIGGTDESWGAIDMSLRVGGRGLAGGSSLARLLARERGVLDKQDMPRLTLRQILAWADHYHEHTGHRRTDASESQLTMNGERWPTIDAALRGGYRGLSGSESLPQLARKRNSRSVQ